MIYIGEANSPVLQEDKDYVKAWAEGVSQQGYRIGIYCAPGMAPAFRDLWPGIFIWIVRPKQASGAFVSPSSQATNTLIAARNPQTSGYVDAVLWQFAWPKSDLHKDVFKNGKQIDHITTPFEAYPDDVFFPPFTGDYGAVAPAFVQSGPTAGRPRFDIDLNSSSVRDPAFPERAMATALVRGGSASAAAIDSSTLAVFAVREGGLFPVTWSSSQGTAAFSFSPDQPFAFHPWAAQSLIQRGANGDLAIVARSAIEGTADDAWQIHSYRRRGSLWSFDETLRVRRCVLRLREGVLCHGPRTQSKHCLLNETPITFSWSRLLTQQRKLTGSRGELRCRCQERTFLSLA